MFYYFTLKSFNGTEDDDVYVFNRFYPVPNKYHRMLTKLVVKFKFLLYYLHFYSNLNLIIT